MRQRGESGRTRRAGDLSAGPLLSFARGVHSAAAAAGQNGGSSRVGGGFFAPF